MEYPESFYCPITHEIMVDPVIDPDGNSYERKAIEDWLSRNNLSPITRRKLSLSDLTPNRALKDSIDLMMAKPKSDKPKKSEKPKKKSKSKKKVDDPIKINVNSKNGYTLISLQPPEGTSRTPCDICCVVDTSGSMEIEATIQNPKGITECHGLSVLDVVKHAVKTIINSLEPSDRLSLVSFNSQARMVFGLLGMNDVGKKQALTALESLVPGGQTNLWGGLETGLEVLRKNSSPQKNPTILLLTDGEPNIVPPRGHLPMLKKYKENHQQFNCTINTFGFGYNLDSTLLDELAVEGNGNYSFIPDSSFVGTIFVNSLSSTLTTMATNATLTIEPLHGAQFVDGGVLGGYPSQTTSQRTQLNLGSLKYGQSIDIVLKMSLPKEEITYLQATLSYSHLATNTPVQELVEGVRKDGGKEIDIHKCRLELVDCIRNALKKVEKDDLTASMETITKFISDLKTSPVSGEAFITDLLKDLEVQITEAFSRLDWYNKWGCHFLPSLMRAHLLQHCNNFKDPGVQHYAGKLFCKIRDQVDDMFCHLPPPKPTHQLPPVGLTGGQTYAPVSMDLYNNASNGCIEGGCLVLMVDGTFKKVKSIEKGDLVQSANGKPSKVLCVVKSYCHQDVAQLVELEGGLLITAWHPVKINNKWCFPCDIGKLVEKCCKVVYNFVLESEHVVIVNGVECVTLGHGFDGDVIEHPYFGTKCVVEDLQNMCGWDTGVVELTSTYFVRSEKTGLVCGLNVVEADSP